MAKVFESGTNLELEQFSYLSKMQGAFIGIPEEGDGKPPHLKNVSVKKKKNSNGEDICHNNRRRSDSSMKLEEEEGEF